MPDVEPETELELIVDGRAHSGWQSCSVTLSMESAAGSFQCIFRDRWQEGGEAFPIREWDEVVVRVAGETVLTGYVDSFEGSYDKAGRKFRVSGRSKTQDLIECSAFLPPSLGLTFEEIATELCSPYGIRVDVTDPRVAADPAFVKPVAQFAPQPGETVFDCLARLARQRGVLVIANQYGDLEIVRAGAQRISRTQLLYGDNILSGTLSASSSERFSRYTVRGQMPGTDDWNGKQAATLVTDSDDENVPRHRPLVLTEDQCEGFDYCEKRALFERNSRAARSERFTYSVQGWTHRAEPWGSVWRPNRLVRAVDEVWGLDADLLIPTLTLVRDIEGGKRTDLDVVHPGAYDLLAAPERVLPKGKKRTAMRPRVLPGVTFNVLTGQPEPSQDPITAGR